MRTQALILAVTGVVPLLTTFLGFSHFLSILGVGSYLVFLVHTLLQSRKTSSTERLEDVENAVGFKDGKANSASMDLDDEAGAEDEDEDDEDAPTWKGFGYLALGGSLIFIFSEPFIDAVSDMAKSLQVSPTLLAFFLAPIASEMPEILESISLSVKGNATNINVAFSNLVGGTITKTTLLMGVFSIYGLSVPLVYESPTFTISLLLMILCSAAAGLMGYFVQRQTRLQAYILFGTFIFTCIVQYMVNSRFGQSMLPFAAQD